MNTIRITTHPGEILKEEFMVPMGLSARALAESLSVPANRITSIINGTRSVTAETAIKLGRHFKTSPDVWMNLQKDHDLSKALAEEARMEGRRRVPVRQTRKVAKARLKAA